MKPGKYVECLRINKPLRLKELCSNGTLVKNEGFYELNGASTFENNCGIFTKRASRMLNDRKIRTSIMLIAFLTCSSAMGYVLATLFPFPQNGYQSTSQKPEVIGTLSTVLKIYNVNDLYTWQVTIKYNQNELKILETLPGDFLGDEQVFTNASDAFPNILMLLGSLKGSVSGRCGNGTLAVIIFGYFNNSYTRPEIILREGLCKTVLLDSGSSEIPFELSNPTSKCTSLALLFP